MLTYTASALAGALLALIILPAVLVLLILAVQAWTRSFLTRRRPTPTPTPTPTLIPRSTSPDRCRVCGDRAWHQHPRPTDARSRS